MNGILIMTKYDNEWVVSQLNDQIQEDGSIRKGLTLQAMASLLGITKQAMGQYAERNLMLDKKWKVKHD